MESDNPNPFRVFQYDQNVGKASLLFDDFNTTEHIFSKFDDFEGGGYDWESVARVVLDEMVSEMRDRVELDAEGSMFGARGSVSDMEELGRVMYRVYLDNDLLSDLLTRAEPDN